MSTQHVKFSVVIPTSIDRGLILPHSIGSVLRQTLQDFEILIIGDGANEFTKEVIHEMMEKDDRIRFFDFPKHPRRGEENRHQVLLHEAKGEFVAYLCDRDLLLPHHLETLSLYLSNFDFASTLNYSMAEGKESMIQSRKDPKRQHAASWLLSCVGHRLDYYKKLPYGWRTTPSDRYTDRYMWEQFLDQPACRSYCGLEPTVLWFKRGDHPGMSSEERKAELIRWEQIMQDQFLFQLKKEEALQQMLSEINYWTKNHFFLIKGMPPRDLPQGLWRKFKKALSQQ